LIQSFRNTLRRLLGRPHAVLESVPSADWPSVLREEAEQLVGMPIRDLALYEQALRHRSLLRGQPRSHLYSNERLEFLGDAVLGFVVAEHLYRHFPEETEGFLTRLRAKLVNGQALARYAGKIDLGAFILMSDNMVQTDGRQNQTILADAFEAVIGALYLDRGMGAARRFIHRTMLDHADLHDMAARRDNFKSLLLEYVQAEGWPQPQYRVVTEEGPSHDRTFTIEVLVNGEPCGRGEASSKKSAEQIAACQALEHLRL
jgi:ribonuclease-3